MKNSNIPPNLSAASISSSSRSRNKYIKNYNNQTEIPLMSKKVKISEEKLLKLTRKAYNKAGADNYFEGKSLHLLCRAVNSQFSNDSKKGKKDPNLLFTLQSRVDDRFNPHNEAWKQAFILVISFLKKYKMELSLNTVIVETPKNMDNQSNIFNRGHQNKNVVPFPINFKAFSSPESVTRIFQNILQTKSEIKNKTFQERITEFIEELEMEDFWQQNPLLVLPQKSTKAIQNQPKAMPTPQLQTNNEINDDDDEINDGILDDPVIERPRKSKTTKVRRNPKSTQQSKK